VTNPREQIVKATLNLVESIRGVVMQAMLMAAKQKHVPLRVSDIIKLNALLNIAIEDGFRKGRGPFIKEIDKVLNAIEFPESDLQKK